VTNPLDLQEVTGVINEWAAALSDGDIARVKRLWDSSYSDLVYIAEENDEPALGWEGIEEYYRELENALGRSSWAVDNLKVDILNDVAWVYLTFVVEAEVKPFKRTMTFNGRNTFLLRKIHDGWKFIHYHESLSRDKSRETWGWFFDN